MKQVKVGIGVVIVHENKILLGKRKGSHWENYWCCPGGHLEHGESVEECSVREVREETGLDVKCTDLHTLGWTEDNTPDGTQQYLTLYVLAKIDGDKTTPEVTEPHKCEEWKWCTLEEIQELDNVLSNLNRLKQALESQSANNTLQPIETAPMDGTHVLLRYYKGGKGMRTRVSKKYVITEAYFLPPYTPDWAIQAGRTDLIYGNEWYDHLGRLIVSMNSKVLKNIPTHWMEMPDTPKE